MDWHWAIYTEIRPSKNKNMFNVLVLEKKKEGGGLFFFRETAVNTRIKHLLLSVQHRE